MNSSDGIKQKIIKHFGGFIFFVSLMAFAVAWLLIVQNRVTTKENQASNEYFDLVLKKEKLTTHFKEIVSDAILIIEELEKDPSGKRLATILKWVDQKNKVLAIYRKKDDVIKSMYGENKPTQFHNFASQKYNLFFDMNISENEVDRLFVEFSPEQGKSYCVVFSAQSVRQTLDSVFVGNLGLTLFFVSKGQSHKRVGDVQGDYQEIADQLIIESHVGQLDADQEVSRKGIITTDSVFPVDSKSLLSSKLGEISINGVSYKVGFPKLSLVSVLPRSILRDASSDFEKLVLISTFIAIFLFLIGGGLYYFKKYKHEVAEEFLKYERKKMVEKARLASIGETAAGIAHEINNPMTVIQMNSEIIKLISEDEKMDVLQIRKSVDNILVTVKRISSIVRGLKTLGREASSDPLICSSLNEIVEDAVSVAKLKVDKTKFEIKVSGMESEVLVDCRPSQLSQVVINLVVNATQAIDHLDQRWVHIDYQVTDNTAILSVTDSGSGIEGKDLQYIFDPFYTTKEVGEGTGLGLSLSKKIVEDHGGQLFVDSQSKHTKFVIELPLSQRQKVLRAEV